MTSTTIVKAHERRKADKPLDPFHRDIQTLIAHRRSGAVGRDVMQAVEILQRFQERRASTARPVAGVTEGLI
ncbi:hypothetical protein [Shinella sp.]|uniref:hypothetical protein n=1 Tax=Shinella sp. TaxID=1870904 RepID=UPI0029B6437D|nr:hypothetical protein [Shinella sp.]MDX3973246.1 hypothetical protein [Shinella sp.]